MPTRRKLISPGDSANGGLERSLSGATVPSSCTIAFWFQWFENNTNRTVVASTTGREQVWTGVPGSDDLNARIGNVAVSTMTIPNPGGWNHFCANFGTNHDGTVDLRVYLNGVDSGTVTSGTDNAFDDGTQTQWLLQDDGADGDWDGEIFDFIMVGGVYTPADMNFDSSSGGQWKDCSASVLAALATAGAFVTRLDGQDSGDVLADSSASTSSWTQSAGGNSVTLSDTDLPPGANPGGVTPAGRRRGRMGLGPLLAA